MIPTLRLLRLLGAWTLLGLGAAVWPRLLPYWRGGAWLLGAALLVDVLLGFWPKGLEGSRTVPATLPLGQWREVVLRLRNPSPFPLDVEVFDEHPADFESRGLPARHRLPARGFLELSYQVRPLARGPRAFGRIHVRAASGLGLWCRSLRPGAPFPVRVFPDFAAVAHYALLATDQRLSLLGILKRPRRGEGLDFHQLREFREGDALRQVDWKASARNRKLISREYQDERDQQVVFLLDCGRRMKALDAVDGDPVGHFDQALNALFLLAYVALKQGDAVGVATFAEDAPRTVAPHKGLATLQQLFQHLFDVQPTLHAPDYLATAEAFLKRFRKRSLVILLTNLRDEEDETLLPALDLLRGRHLVMLANLKEGILESILARPVHGFEDALEHAGALDYQARRQVVFRRIAHGGTHILDVTPAKLPTSLVNRYLELKASGAF
ncbi:DUF58 domain-containing protein [Mesoterricola silvestris]|uniref:DUF58 domain-containing protein n=1 Tax=Mesoterricola silvestris TaxID=2927979 RepID=A0AA48KCF0_9BACT|nr:DUF58 domain-containing protein [Mesoterricola silvestris]BDU73433.1 hypothetical protein METEAL_26070 [Mesoterricola silvestris]